MRRFLAYALVGMALLIAIDVVVWRITGTAASRFGWQAPLAVFALFLVAATVVVVLLRRHSTTFYVGVPGITERAYLGWLRRVETATPTELAERACDVFVLAGAAGVMLLRAREEGREVVWEVVRRDAACRALTQTLPGAVVRAPRFTQLAFESGPARHGALENVMHALSADGLADMFGSREHPSGVVGVKRLNQVGPAVLVVGYFPEAGSREGVLASCAVSLDTVIEAAALETWSTEPSLTPLHSAFALFIDGRVTFMTAKFASVAHRFGDAGVGARVEALLPGDAIESVRTMVEHYETYRSVSARTVLTGDTDAVDTLALTLYPLRFAGGKVGILARVSPDDRSLGADGDAAILQRLVLLASERVPSAVVVLSPAGRVVLVSDAALSLLGTSRERVTRQRLLDLVTEETLSAVASLRPLTERAIRDSTLTHGVRIFDDHEWAFRMPQRDPRTLLVSGDLIRGFERDGAPYLLGFVLHLRERSRVRQRDASYLTPAAD
jgi:PAS domain-containing protein